MDSTPRPEESVTNDDVDAAASGDSDCSSFEMLLPDFSSLAIGETSETLSKEERIYSKIEKSRVDQNQFSERYVLQSSVLFLNLIKGAVT